MKYALLLAALLGAGYYAYSHRNVPQTLERPFGSYALTELAEKPMPAAVMLDGMKFYALDVVCKEDSFHRFSGMNQAQCEGYVNASHDACKRVQLPRIPALYHREQEIDQYSGQYLNCVLPPRGQGSR